MTGRSSSAGDRTVESAKRPETRAARIATAVTTLRDGGRTP